MPHDVIAISRTLGAGGEDLGQALSKELGYRYLDNEIIAAASEKAGLAPEEMARVEERKGLVERILAGLAVSGAGSFDAGAYAALSPADLASPNYEGLIVDVVRETAAEGNAVIVAHGASMALAGRTGLLRVLVTASPDVRAHRVADAESVDESEAVKMVKDSDKAREQYFRRFYDIRDEEPTHYDLIINTDAVDLNVAAGLIAGLAKG